MNGTHDTMQIIAEVNPMKVYVVLFESGRIYGVYKTKLSARKVVKEMSDTFYENATIREEIVR